jgi:iron complex transport system substrate-binding protein
MRHLLTLALLALAPIGVSADDLPRVVSVNLCTDQLVMLIADADQVVSLSQLSDDPRSSAMAEEALSFAKNRALAEEIAVSVPDIVIAGTFTDPSLIGMLRTIDIEVVQFPLTISLDEIPGQIRKMGKVLDRVEVAEELALEVEDQLAPRGKLEDDAPLAAFFYPNGFALGEGTLSHSILTAGGARNLSVDLGFSGNGRVSLEEIVLHKPDFLISSPPYSGFSQSEAMTMHPVLDGFPVLYGTPDWVCGTPHALRAVAQVEAMVQSMLRLRSDEK